MGKGSLKASAKGIELAKNALDRGIFCGNQTALREDLNDPNKELADDLNDETLKEQVKKENFSIARSTLSKFFNGKPVNRFYFRVICDRLNLNWEEIFEPPSEEEQQENNSSQINALVQDIRQKVHDDIEQTCGTMRVLDMTQPIDLGSIYTEVNILEKITGRRRINLNELSEALNLEDFDRFSWIGVKEKRVEGEKAVQDHNKLMVLGKPGAGKTTFLKYLAMQCNKGEFLENCVPVFIPLKQFAETKNQPSLHDYISHWLDDRKVTEAQIKALELLEAGRAFVLLDGLDEVREEDSDRIIKEIREFSDRFSSSQFVITCRIAAKEYTFTQFTEVEVADFKKEQIRKFTKNWFKIQNKLDYTNDFVKQLDDNKQIEELATNPLLLTLLCLEFQDSRSFPADRAELYKRATQTLLRKWDDKRGIKREQVYKQLSVKRKEDLLSQIAFSTFNEKNYFFKRGIVENHIADYIINLPDAPAEKKKLHLDSGAVLKSIEAQHGLLVERAKGIYSFSHLTFQEYFTAQQIVSGDKEALEDLVKHITEKRWREVFLLTAGMLKKADNLLKLMKTEVDILLKKNKKLQEFLKWVYKKAEP
ncbi:MAG: NACHT domain-containing protein, partial [Cyanobacteria bacterium J06639_18]